MGHRGFNRQWAAFADQPREHRSQGRRGGGHWSDWAMAGSPPWAGRQGPPPWVAGLFGLNQGEQRRGPRVRRGDVRSAILSVITTSAAGESTTQLNGYQVMQEISQRSGGAWKPSPGSVYPTIQQLQDEGLVATADDGKGLVLTQAGTMYVADHADELAAVWAPFDRSEVEEEQSGFATLKPEIGQVMGAVWQIISSGSETQQRAAIDVLVETRRKLYGILADGDESTDEATDESSDDQPEEGQGS